MPSLSVVSPLDVLRESQMSRILADKINANNALLSRYGKRGEPVNLLQVSRSLLQFRNILSKAGIEPLEADILLYEKKVAY